MAANSQPLEITADLIDAASDPARAEIVVLPFGEARRRVAEVRKDCETLRQGVRTLQQCLWTIEGFVAKIDDGLERMTLQRQIESVNRLLMLRQYELSDIERSLQAALRPVSGRAV